MILKSIKQGFFDSFQRKKLIFIFWLINIIISILFLFPYISEFNRFFSQRMVSHILEIENEYAYLMEFLHYSSTSIASTAMRLIGGKLVVMVISLALSGGIISIFLEKEPVTVKHLLSESQRFLVRIILLSFLHIVVLAFFFLLSSLFYLPASLLLSSIFVENVYLYFFLGWALLAFLFVLLAFMLFDLSRIQLIAQNQSSIFRAYWTAVVSFIKRPLSIYLVYLLLAIFWMLVMFLYWKLQSFLSDTSTLGLLMEFVLLQFFIWFQYGIRLSRYSALIYVSETKRMNP